MSEIMTVMTVIYNLEIRKKITRKRPYPLTLSRNLQESKRNGEELDSRRQTTLE